MNGINDERVNHLALTVMIEEEIIPFAIAEPYNFYIEHNIKFYFELNKGILFAIMQSLEPFNEYTEKVKVNNKYIIDTLKILGLI